MFPLGMGVAGAAAATGLSQVGAAAVYFYFLIKRHMLPPRRPRQRENGSDGRLPSEKQLANQESQPRPSEVVPLRMC